MKLLDRKQINTLRSDACIGATTAISAAIHRHGELNPNLKSLLLLQILESLNCGVGIPGIRVLGGLDPNPDDDLDPRRDDNRLTALIIHNLILRRDGASYRAVIEQTVREYAVRYDEESYLGKLILENVDKWSTRSNL